MESSNAEHGAMLTPNATSMETFTGRFVDCLNPDPETIDAEDIAHHLSVTCRYGGGIGQFYSVAEHSLFVRDLTDYYLTHVLHVPHGDMLLAALLHDGSEYVLQDIVSPLKYALRLLEYEGNPVAPPFDEFKGTYQRLSIRMDKAIAARFGLNAELFDEPAIRLCDMWALRIEARALTFTQGENWRWRGELPEGGHLPRRIRWRGGVHPAMIEREFFSALMGLLNQRDYGRSID